MHTTNHHQIIDIFSKSYSENCMWYLQQVQVQCALSYATETGICWKSLQEQKSEIKLN